MTATQKAATGEVTALKNAWPRTVPAGFNCTKNGVLTKPKEGAQGQRVTHKPIWVSALSRDGSLANWGKLVQWIDSDDSKHECAIPAKMFHSNGNELAQELAGAGLPIVPGQERLLLRYLAAFTPEQRLVAAVSTGWQKNGTFVLPKQTLFESSNETTIFQPEEYKDTSSIHSNGNLDDWKHSISESLPLVCFAIAAALAAPLALKTNSSSGGFHFFGRTSQGKTTLLQAAASVWGCGVDPAIAGGEAAYIQRWNSTKNGLEGVAACFNDLPLIVDEIGEADGRDFGRIIYQLMSGTGRQRATRSGGMRKRRVWRILLLSSGELPVSDFLENARGGQLVRLIDIPAEDMFSGEGPANAMKNACSEFYGTAGPEFLKSGNLLQGWSEFNPENIGIANTPEAGRVRDRFRLVAYAGELAITKGILPWASGAVLEACQRVYSSWVSTGAATDDAHRGIQNVKEYLQAYGESHFSQDNERVPLERAGVYRDGKYHFFPKSFKKACAGVLDTTVKKALKTEGLLHVDEPGRNTSRVRIDGTTTRVVSIDEKILDYDKTTGHTGQSGHTPYKQRAAAVPTNKKALGTLGTAELPVTTLPTSKNELGTPETLINKGPCPPCPPCPPKNSKTENHEQPEMVLQDL